MPALPETIVLDSWSAIAFLEDEAAARQVGEIIAEAHESGTRLLMSVVNLGEVWYITARETSGVEGDRRVSVLQSLGIEFADVDWKLAREAARLKGKCRMSFADCFAAALARRERGQLLTGDREFKQVEPETHIRWL